MHLSHARYYAMLNVLLSFVFFSCPCLLLMALSSSFCPCLVLFLFYTSWEQSKVQDHVIILCLSKTNICNNTYSNNKHKSEITIYEITHTLSSNTYSHQSILIWVLFSFLQNKLETYMLSLSSSPSCILLLFLTHLQPVMKQNSHQKSNHVSVLLKGHKQARVGH